MTATLCGPGYGDADTVFVKAAPFKLPGEVVEATGDFVDSIRRAASGKLRYAISRDPLDF